MSSLRHSPRIVHPKNVSAESAIHFVANWAIHYIETRFQRWVD
jgi:hypothetical protein